jgi:hypothetical protein
VSLCDDPESSASSPPGTTEFARARGGAAIQGALGACHDPLGSVEDLQLETRVMCPPGLEVEIELAPLAVAETVGDENLNHVLRAERGLNSAQPWASG